MSICYIISVERCKETLQTSKNPYKKRKGAVFVGSLLHGKNKMEIKANIDEVLSGLKEKDKNAIKTITATVNEVRKRGPGWISKAVREEYGIKAQDPELKKSLRIKSGNNIKLGGISVDDVVFEYSGRVLTPTHFKMQPKERPRNGHPYQISAEIKKGQRKVLSPIAFLGASGGAGTTMIPFQRKGKERLPIMTIKTLSVPQMIQNGQGETKPGITKALNDGIEKRFYHHAERYLKK